MYLQKIRAALKRQNPKTLEADPKAATGRTTARAFKYLSDAMQNPGHAIRVYDHYHTADADKHLLRQMAMIVEKLGYSGFYYNMRNCTVTFNIYERKKS